MIRASLVANEVYLQRVPTFIDYSHDIQTYGEDNLYPQRAEFTRDRSYTTKTAVKRYAGFVAGQGFTDPALSQLVVNRKGHTMNDILMLLSKDYGTFESFALHLNYNLNYRISSIKFVKLKFARFGLGSTFGDVYEIKVNNNWERNPWKQTNGYIENIYTYPVFDPDPARVKEQMAMCGGIRNYPGQILMYTPSMWEYPEATFDPVFDYAQVQHELGVFDISKIQNGLTATTVFKYPGEFKTADEEAEFISKLRRHKGAQGANSTLVVQNPTGARLDLTENIQLQNLDKLHTELNKNAKDSIRENYSQPAEIHGRLPEAGMFNQENIREAYTYYNSLTQDSRDAVSRQIKKIMEHWWQQNAFSSYDIKQKEYGQAVNNSGQSKGNPAGSRV